MGNVFVNESILQGWADAIREKLGITTKMKPSELLEKTKTELDDKDLLNDFLVSGISGDFYNEEFTRIKSFAFAGTSITSVTLVNVETLPINAFQNCFGLIDANFPKVTSTGQYVFENCYYLENVNLSNVKELGSTTFYSCQRLKNIDASLVEKIGQQTFYGCKSLEIIDFPMVQTVAAYNVFYGCNNLKTINLPNWTTISDNNQMTSTFYNCSSLENITLGNDFINVNVSFAHSSLLTDESIQNIINALATVETAKTLTLHADVKAKLTEEQLAIIAGKNWAVK